VRAISNNIWLIIVSLAAIVGVVAGIYVIWSNKRRNAVTLTLNEASIQAKEILAKAEVEGEKRQKEILLEVKDEIHRLRSEADREQKERRTETQRQEKRLLQKEENLDRKLEVVEKKENELLNREKDIQVTREEVEVTLAKQVTELERIAGLSSDEGKKILLGKLETELRYESAMLIKNIELETRETSEKKAREIVTMAIQRCAVDHSVESTVSVVTLPNDEMKGRIIGREGRNIRALETATGIDLIIDDTPEAVILSSFDPVRREIARITLEKLIADGRIHPARIEEMVEKAKKEVEQKMKEEGEAATFETGIQGVHPEIIKTLGRLRYRTSYGQNVLQHSKEVTFIAGLIAAELGANVAIAKRGALLHDLGKAIDHDQDGSHAVLGAELARRYNESPKVIHCIKSHHNDESPETVEAVIVSVADAISAARPGARRENIEVYIKRLEKLEKIAQSFEGIEKSFAIQAGREIRVMVIPEQVDDSMSVKLARDIAKKIEGEMEYPGQIKVTVVREVRATEYAK
jgi:ribonuclease Y